MFSDAGRLRTLEDVFVQDRRQKYFSVVNMRTGESRKKTLDDHYAKVSVFALRESVPDNIRIHFETAKNLLLYSWFVYNFISVAEMQAYASAEYALRERIGTAAGEKPGLKRLLKYAVEHNVIEDSKFRRYARLSSETLQTERL